MKTSNVKIVVAAVLSALLCGGVSTSWGLNTGIVGKKNTLGSQPAKLGSFGSGQIVTVSGTRVIGKNASGNSIKFSVPASTAAHLNVGQRLWSKGNRVMGVQFPIRMATKNERLHSKRSHWMKTSITISNTGRIDGQTRTWSNECARGFTGGVVVFLRDEQGNILYNTSLHKYGVNGECLGDPHDRKEVWSDPVPQDVLNKVRSVAIVQLVKPTDRWNDFMKKAKQVAEIAKVFVETYVATKTGS